MSIYSELSELVVPERCRICGRRVHSKLICSMCEPLAPSAYNICVECGAAVTHREEPLCRLCRSKRNPIRLQRSLWIYEYQAAELIQAMKYQPNKRLCRLAGGILAESVGQLFSLQDWTHIVAAPSSPRGLLKRGFNHVDILVREIHRRLPSIKTTEGILKLPLLSSSQASKSRSERRKRRKVRCCCRLPGGRILLVDDVITSGQTARDSAAALRAAGAEAVDLLVLARSVI